MSQSVDHRSKLTYRHGPGFTILAQGRWELSQVQAAWYATTQVPRTALMEEHIEAQWSTALDLAREQGQLLFTTDLVRLDRAIPSKNKLYLYTSPTTYRDYVGTNKNIHKLRLNFSGREWLAGLANPLALCVCLRSRDGHLLVAQRSARTYDHPGYFHVPGGHIEVARHIVGRRVALRLALLDELQEEFGIAAVQVREVFCTGVIADSQSRKPEVLLAAQVQLWHHDLIAPRNEEHGSQLWLLDHPQALARFLLQRNRLLVPAGKACLLLYGRWRYGTAWYRRLNRRLSLVAD